MVGRCVQPLIIGPFSSKKDKGQDMSQSVKVTTSKDKG
jgi:hypothetical protein